MNNGQMKFRVWDGCKMILIEGDTYLMFFNSPNRLPWAVYDYTKARIADGHKWSGEVLMQSTGLIDKNGVLVFDGDVLGGMLEGFAVLWCEKCAGYQLHCAEAIDHCHACEGDIHWWEVVQGIRAGDSWVDGNICDR